MPSWFFIFLFFSGIFSNAYLSRRVWCVGRVWVGGCFVMVPARRPSHVLFFSRLGPTGMGSCVETSACKLERDREVVRERERRSPELTLSDPSPPSSPPVTQHHTRITEGRSRCYPGGLSRLCVYACVCVWCQVCNCERKDTSFAVTSGKMNCQEVKQACAL